MFGLIVFGLMGIYLLLLIGATVWAYRRAAKKSLPRKQRWLWAVGAFLLMYLPVFWDHIPTIIAHKYYCEKEAGFWVYKTVEQWKVDNPGVAETLTWREIPDRSDTIQLPGGVTKNILNDRFTWEIHRRRLPFLPTTISEELVIDQKTKDILARRISVGSNYGNLAVGGNDWRVIKFWLSLEPCIPEGNKFGFFLTEVKRIGAKK